jgi:hypothetical protein
MTPILQALLCIFAMGFMQYIQYDAFGFAVVLCAWLEVLAAELSLKMTGDRPGPVGAPS